MSNLLHASEDMYEDGEDAPVPGPVHTDTGNLTISNGDEWQKRNILSLDGGGIRGYWSLLLLEKLMDSIANEEESEAHDEPHLHSFRPIDLPRNLIQSELTDEERLEMNESTSSVNAIPHVPRTRRYLPCHYFNQIGGSSTGALIAIMLGRFRMTVQDCLAEYRNLGQKVFGKPRMFSTIRIGTGGYKYKASRLKDVFENVAQRRSEKKGSGWTGRIAFPSGKHVCTTFVTTMRTEADSRSDRLYLIRSYDYEPTFSPRPSPETTMNPPRADTGASTLTKQERQQDRRSRVRDAKDGIAQDFEVWQVARAATAAKTYFKPLEIVDPSNAKGGKISFTDGGISQTNNPTHEAKREIEDLYGYHSVGVVVSVGTARKNKEDDGKRRRWSVIKRVKGLIEGFADPLTDPETVHRQVREQHCRRPDFSYYRLNDPGGLDITLDEWEPKSEKSGGAKTIEAMEQSFAKWALKRVNQQKIDQCAKELVECRRQRSATPGWERYATGCQIKCRENVCNSRKFINSEAFKKHLRDHHDYTNDHEIEGKLKTCRKRWEYKAATTAGS